MASRGRMMLNLALQKLQKVQVEDTLSTDEDVSSDFSSEDLDDSVNDQTWVPKKRDLELVSSDSDDSLYTYCQKRRRKQSVSTNDQVVNVKADEQVVKVIVESNEEQVIVEANRPDVIVEANRQDVIVEANEEEVITEANMQDVIVEANEEEVIVEANRPDVIVEANEEEVIVEAIQEEITEEVNEEVIVGANRQDVIVEANEQEVNVEANEQDVNVNVIAIDHEETVITTESINRNENGPQRNEENPPKAKAKHGFAKPDTWKVNVNKKQRMLGKEYSGRKRVDGKNQYLNQKQARIQGDRGCTARCHKWKMSRQCNMISESTRKEIFTLFWSEMNWSQKQVYVCSLVEKRETNKKTVHTHSSRRKFSYIYFIRQGDVKVQVCKNLFLSTFGIGESMLYNWMNDTTHGMPRDKEDKRGKVEGVEMSANKEFARKFLEDLPKLPSHYCRASTDKQYLEPVFNTFTDLHRVYKERCREHSKSPVSLTLLSNLFSQMNLSLFHPKKDKCDLCCGYETQNVAEEVYQDHVEKKQRAREEKAKDKKASIENDDVKVLTMDLQAVMICLRVNASAVYYKTKLACHNFTTYDLGNGDVSCYFWHEGEGNLTADSFASCITDTLMNLIEENNNVKEIILFSDGCGYQNRNSTLANTLLLFSTKYNITITQKYLERGHTQMEADSVHSTIERILRKKDIYSPHNYVNYISLARPSQPYRVKYVENDFFKSYSSLKYYDSIRPGKKVGDPHVNDIRVLQYTPSGNILYKLSFDDVFQEIPKRRNFVCPKANDVVESLHSGPLQIKKTKYDHLQQLKDVVPKDYHSFYDNLLHKA